MSNAQILPPKMALQYAERARNGEADHTLSGDIYEFYLGNQVICIIGLDNPTGHVRKVTTQEMQRLRASALPLQQDQTHG
jgi:hypothetical protein